MSDEQTAEQIVDDATPDAQVDDRAAGADADAAADPEAEAAALEARAESDPRSRVELLGELEEVEQQRDEYLDDLRRSHADFENYRKRVARDGALQRDHGRADVVNALLDVLDDLDRVAAAADALDGASLHADVGAVASGIRVVAEKAQRALATFGVERVDATGVPFDPTVHDAVQQVEADAVEGSDGGDTTGPTVHQVLRAGYRQADRVLRPAMVVVAQ